MVRGTISTALPGQTAESFFPSYFHRTYATAVTVLQRPTEPIQNFLIGINSTLTAMELKSSAFLNFGSRV